MRKFEPCSTDTASRDGRVRPARNHAARSDLLLYCEGRSWRRRQGRRSHREGRGFVGRFSGSGSACQSTAAPAMDRGASHSLPDFLHHSPRQKRPDRASHARRSPTTSAMTLHAPATELDACAIVADAAARRDAAGACRRRHQGRDRPSGAERGDAVVLGAHRHHALRAGRAGDLRARRNAAGGGRAHAGRQGPAAALRADGSPRPPRLDRRADHRRGRGGEPLRPAPHHGRRGARQPHRRALRQRPRRGDQSPAGG